MWWSRKIHELQQKPYAERLRLLWKLVILAAMVVILVWIIGLRLRKQTRPDQSQWTPLIENFNRIKAIKLWPH